MSCRTTTLSANRAVHRALRAGITAALMLGVVAASGTARAEQVINVDQLTDPTATAATGMFRFDPNFIQAKPGEPVIILNSLRNHTVHSVPQLWPQGVERVSIAGSPRSEIVLRQEGVYAFTCERHGTYGMVMLVIVGSPDTGPEILRQVDKVRGSSREKKALNALLERYLETRSES